MFIEVGNSLCYQWPIVRPFSEITSEAWLTATMMMMIMMMVMMTCIRWHFAVACSLGTWYNLATGTCEFCPAGTYQDTEGQLSCQPCPHKLYGVGTQGAKNITECGGKQASKHSFNDDDDEHNQGYISHLDMPSD